MYLRKRFTIPGPGQAQLNDLLINSVPWQVVSWRPNTCRVPPHGKGRLLACSSRSQGNCFGEEKHQSFHRTATNTSFWIHWKKHNVFGGGIQYKPILENFILFCFWSSLLTTINFGLFCLYMQTHRMQWNSAMVSWSKFYLFSCLLRSLMLISIIWGWINHKWSKFRSWKTLWLEPWSLFSWAYWSHPRRASHKSYKSNELWFLKGHSSILRTLILRLHMNEAIE